MKTIPATLTFLTCLFLAAATNAGLRDPFPSGFSMGTLGAVVDDRGASGREPWTSSIFCRLQEGFGFALAGASYYGTAGKGGISRATGGGWYGRRHLICKASISHLNAFGAYFEQSGFVSAGSDVLPFVRLSVEATGYRIGVNVPETPVRTIGEGGVSAWVPWSWAAISLRLEHLVFAAAQSDGADPRPTLRCGIHSAQNSFGGQGAVVTIVPTEPRPVCFTVGEEYRITPAVSFHAAFSNNPVLLAFGMAVSFGRGAAALALVNHSELGWSQGFGAEYYKKRTAGRE
jgi:hypothetical protein